MKRGKDMKKLLATGLLFSLLIFSTGCLDVEDAPIPPESPLFSGELKSAVGHGFAQDVKRNQDLFMKPISFQIVDDSRVDMYTYNDFAEANPALQAKFASAKAVMNLDYDLANSFVLVFCMHVTTGSLSKGTLTDHYGALYFIVGAIQNDDVDETARIEKFKIQGIGGGFQGFEMYQVPRDIARVTSPWLSVSGEGKIKYDRKTGEPKFMSLKGTVNGVIPGQVIFEFPFKTKLRDS